MRQMAAGLRCPAARRRVLRSHGICASAGRDEARALVSSFSLKSLRTLLGSVLPVPRRGDTGTVSQFARCEDGVTEGEVPGCR